MRPTFELPLDADPAVVLQAFDDALAEGRHPVRGTVAPPNADLRVPDDDKHFFSPVLCVRVREEGGQVRLSGRFAPHPHVWTMFIAIYFVLGIGGVAGGVFGISQWMLKQTPWALVAIPISLGLIAFVYGAAFIGQGLGASQMYSLRNWVDHVLESLGLPTTTDEHWGAHTSLPTIFADDFASRRRPVRMRPTFVLRLDATAEQVLQAFSDALVDGGHAVDGKVTATRADLRVVSDDTHFFAPRLRVRLRDDGGRLRLRGRFAPAPQVWTLFMALYGVLGVVGLAGGVYGISQWTAQLTPWALVAVPFSVVLMGLVYGATFIGQGLGAGEMYQLRSWVDHVLESKGLSSADDTSVH